MLASPPFRCIAMIIRVTTTTLAALLALARAAPAAPVPPGPPDPLRPVAYALVVGTNRGGPGQGDLRYAERDARRVAEVLGDLGGYQASRVELIEQPSRTQMLEALAAVGSKLAEHATRGEKTLFLFYYSGHARSTGLNLGREILPLHELRERLSALPSTVVLAVLDACQSGAFSRVKGAEPAADFSFNSVTQLSTAGIAVMASSGASELSQESDRLQSSFFTHHLLAALRGVADLDRDGHVTLAEAYRYAYHRTLTDTASTSVGSQHVTLETGLRGKGELVLSYPAQASAQLDLPLAMRGEVLIERRPSGSVIAELHKAAGEPLRLALPPGEYRAVWRQEAEPGGGGRAAAPDHPREVRLCRLLLQENRVTSLDPGGCTASAEATVASKGAPPPPPSPWALELSFGEAWSTDGYQPTFTHRGFQRTSGDQTWTLDLSAIRALAPNLELLLDLRQLDAQTYRRRFEEQILERFSWRVLGTSAQLRAVARLWDGRFNIYLQGGLGLSLGRTTYVTSLDDGGRPRDGSQLGRTWFPGFFGTVANGVMVGLHRQAALFVQLRYTEVNDVGRYDPAVNQGGHITDLMLGLRLGAGRINP
jgi:hypothetical protein